MKIDFIHYSSSPDSGSISFDKEGAEEFRNILRTLVTDIVSDITNDDGFDAQTVSDLCQSIEQIEELIGDLDKTEVQA